MSYILKSVPKSTKQVIDAASHDKVLLITKNAVANYIRSFLDTTGVNRALAEQIGSHSLKYITDKSLSTDPTERKTQLALMSEQIKEQVPAILIADTGFQWVPATVGSVTGRHFEDGREITKFDLVFNTNLTVVVLSNDETSCKDLTTLLICCFGPLRRLGNGIFFRSDNIESNWVVTLPYNFTTAIPVKVAASETATSVDNTWHGDINFENVRYENTVDIKTVVPTTDTANGVVGNVSTPINIGIPNTLTVGQQQEIVFTFMPFNAEWTVSQNDRVVLFHKSPDSVTAIKPGTFTIIVRDRTKNVELAKKDITVTF